MRVRPRCAQARRPGHTLEPRARRRAGQDRGRRTLLLGRAALRGVLAPRGLGERHEEQRAVGLELRLHRLAVVVHAHLRARAASER